MPITRHMAKNLPRYIKQVDTYLEEREAQGLGVPESSRSAGTASLAAIANGTGIPRWVFRRSQELRGRIAAWGPKIGFSPADKPDRSENGYMRAQMLRQKAELYLSQLRKEQRRLPENPRSRGDLDWERISSESDIPVNSLTHGRPVVKLILGAVGELGLEIFPEASDWHGTTYGELLAAGSAWRKEELRDKPWAAQQLANTRSKLKYFMLHAGVLIRKSKFKDADLVGGELLERFKGTIRRLAEKIESGATRRSFSREMQLWQEYFLRLLRDKDLPPQFSSALDAALDRAGMTAEDLAVKAGVRYQLLYSWLTKSKAPSIESYPRLRRIEKILSLPPDALVSRVIRTRAKQFSPTCYPEHVVVDGEEIKLRGNGRVLVHLRPLLPDDYEERPMEERAEVAAWLIKNLVRPATAWSRWHRPLCTLPYAMKEFPPTLKGEWEELHRYKRDALPPIGMRRSGTWTEEGAQIAGGELSRFMSFLTLSPDGEDPRFLGLGFDPSCLTLAVLTLPRLTDLYVRWKAGRRQGGPSAQSYSSTDLQFVQFVRKLLLPEHGWLRQKPELASHLRPIPGFIDKSFIKRAKSGWGKLCDEAVEDYTHLASGIEEVAEEQRDPFELIISLLDPGHEHYHNPISALRTFAQNIINDMPDPSIAAVKAATQVRNYLIVRVLSVTGLRSRNLRELTYRDDNTGHLRRNGSKWEVVIPWQSFKNSYSSFFGPKKKKHNYERVLRDRDGLYDWIEEYVQTLRPVLLGGRESDIFFLSRRNDPFMSANKFHRTYRKLTAVYFAHNPYLGRGIPGVKPHGPHAVRDMLATYILQQTGSYELAAYVIGDTAWTVRKHYGRFVPKDKMRLPDSLIDEAWND
jgi:integrase/transcriptional regulator with XRE-family HTH domain